MKSEKILRRVDDVYLIDSLGNILISDVRDISDEFVIPSDEDYDLVLEGGPVFISDNLENKTTVMIKLNSLVDTYLYISRNIDPEILRYLNETKEAVSFYYSVENSQTGIKVTFAIIYIIVVTLLLFLSTISILRSLVSIFLLKGISFQFIFGIPISVSTKLFPKILDFSSPDDVNKDISFLLLSFDKKSAMHLVPFPQAPDILPSEL